MNDFRHKDQNLNMFLNARLVDRSHPESQSDPGCVSLFLTSNAIRPGFEGLLESSLD